MIFLHCEYGACTVKFLEYHLSLMCLTPSEASPLVLDGKKGFSDSGPQI